MIDSTNKAAALALANRGIRVFPCNINKTPTLTAWEDAATNSVFEISMKWDAAPTSLPALPVGAHGLLVIDADRKAGGPDGVAAFHALCVSEGIDLSVAFVIETPSTGQHFYFASSTPYGNSPGSLPDGIDVRGVGGYCIAPGATLPDGRSYRIVSGSWDAIPPLPDALARFLREKRAAPMQSLDIGIESIPAGDRERRCASAALADEVAKLSAMREGSGRNRALNDAAHSLGTMSGWIDLNEVAAALYQVSVQNGYTAKDGASAAQQTITSGIEAGRKKPRKLLTEWTDEELTEEESWLRPLIEAAKRKLLTPPPISAKSWPVPLNASAYIGILGDFIRLVAPQTEGDPCALLIAALTVMGSIMGRSAYLRIGADDHYPNLFATIVAETSKGRKGTVMGEAKRFARMIDPSIASRMLGGMSSGEGLIEAVRDTRHDDTPAEAGQPPTLKVLDNGVGDKRLLVTESEMGQALQAAGRDGNTLSATLRLAWDGEALRTLARSNKNVCLEPHVSIFGNITLDELQRLLTSTDRSNGFANRFLWVCAQRSQLLPFGGHVDEAALQALADRAAHALRCAAYYRACGWTPDAASLWAREYTRLSSGRPGLAGAMTARAEAQTLRIALIYAILDGCNNLDVHHLQAALEVWRYCEESVVYCFGSASGDSTVERIVGFLVNTPDGATRAMISKLFNNHKTKDELERAYASLLTTHRARFEWRGTGNKKTQYWYSC